MGIPINTQTSRFGVRLNKDFTTCQQTFYASVTRINNALQQKHAIAVVQLRAFGHNRAFASMQNGSFGHNRAFASMQNGAFGHNRAFASMQNSGFDHNQLFCTLQKVDLLINRPITCLFRTINFSRDCFQTFNRKV